MSLTPAGAADAGAFLARLVRLDPAALVRLRPAGDARVACWARLPWDVLVSRTVAGSTTEDATVSAADLLAAVRPGEVALPPRQDGRWHWALPPGGGRLVEALPAAQLRQLDAAAAATVRAAAAGGVAGRPVGERTVRDALLDHEAIVVEVAGDVAAATVTKSTVERVAVPQRLVQAVVRMGFLRPHGYSTEPPVHVLVASRFVGLAAEYGVAWYQKSAGLTIRAII